MTNDLRTLPLLVKEGRVVSAAEYKADFRARMQQLEVTQRHLCDEMGTDHARISKWLRPNHDLRLLTIARMERALADIINKRRARK